MKLFYNQNQINAQKTIFGDIDLARNYPDPDVKTLFALSGGRCAFPRCNTLCTVEKTANDKLAIVGEIAHIVGHKSAGPRGSASYPANLIDTYENWILLCPTHHSLVDKQANTYTVADLKKWKADHENTIQLSIQQSLSKVTFTELEIVTRALISNPTVPTVDLTLTNPTQKIELNKLEKVGFLITMGLSVAAEVQKYVTHQSLYDPTFPERLTTGFLDEYNLLVRQGITGEGLFNSLREFAIKSINGREFVHQSAVLAVLSYLFEKCEIFEK